MKIYAWSIRTSTQNIVYSEREREREREGVRERAPDLGGVFLLEAKRFVCDL